MGVWQRFVKRVNRACYTLPGDVASGSMRDMSFRRSLGLALILSGAVLADRVTSVGAQRPPDLKGLARRSLSKLDGDGSVPGVREPARIIRDPWRVTHL